MAGQSSSEFSTKNLNFNQYLNLNTMKNEAQQKKRARARVNITHLNRLNTAKSRSRMINQILESLEQLPSRPIGIKSRSNSRVISPTHNSQIKIGNNKFSMQPFVDDALVKNPPTKKMKVLKYNKRPKSHSGVFNNIRKPVRKTSINKQEAIDNFKAINTNVYAKQISNFISKVNGSSPLKKVIISFTPVYRALSLQKFEAERSSMNSRKVCEFKVSNSKNNSKFVKKDSISSNIKSEGNPKTSPNSLTNSPKNAQTENDVLKSEPLKIRISYLKNISRVKRPKTGSYSTSTSLLKTNNSYHRRNKPQKRNQKVDKWLNNKRKSSTPTSSNGRKAMKRFSFQKNKKIEKPRATHLGHKKTYSLPKSELISSEMHIKKGLIRQIMTKTAFSKFKYRNKPFSISSTENLGSKPLQHSLKPILGSKSFNNQQRQVSENNLEQA